LTWRFVDSGWATGARQMAVDDALLSLCGRDQSPPTLRLFGFRPACLSLGRFQPAEQAPRPPGLDVVRRPTGGGAVIHRGDVCYSVVLPISHPLAAGSIVESYRRFARGLAAGLEALGLPPLAEAAAGPPARGGWCFETVAAHELTLAGRKLVGSAQSRRAGALLQQGSIRLAPEPAEAALATSLQEALGREVAWEELVDALILGFAGAWGIEIHPGSLTAEEEELARRLEHERYRNSEWTSAPGPTAARTDTR
jgi:lipoate-protein ligase A